MTTPSKWDERYEGDFLDAITLPEGALVPVTIAEVIDPYTERDRRKKLIDAGILRFEGKDKRLILNTTNKDVLRAMFGGRANWVGKTIHLQRRYLKLNTGFAEHIGLPAGETECICVRIIPPKGTHLLVKTARQMGSATPSIHTEDVK